MRPILYVLALFFLTATIETGFVIAYHSATTGVLSAPIAAHTDALKSGAIPPASEIDLEHDDWTQVAHFESTFYQVQLIVDIVMSVVIAWFLIRGGISAAISRKAEGLSFNVHISRSLYLIFFSVLLAAITIPLSISGYLIAALRGTSLMTPDMLIFSMVQNIIVGIIFALLTFVPFYWIMDRFQKWWWAVGAAFLATFTIATVFVGPVLIEPLYIDAQPLEDSLLTEKIRGLAERAHVPLEDIYVSDTGGTTLESNAFVSGLGSTKRVVLDDTLIQFYTPDEITTVVGHEFGHYVLGHLWYDMAVMTILTFFSFGALAFILHWCVKHYGKAIGTLRVNDIVLFPLISTLLSLISILTAPVPSAISREFERQADAYALEITANPKAAADAFTKLTYQSFIDPAPPPLMQWWFGRYPTPQERIAFLRQGQW